MSLNPQPDASIKPRPITLHNPSVRSLSTERFSYPQLKIDEPQINISRKEYCFQGHLFIPQTIHSSIMQTERLRINTNTRPTIPMIGKNRSTLQIGTKQAIENAFKIQKGPLNIKVESDIRKHQYQQHTIDNGRISFRTPIRTAREDSQRAKAFARVYNAPSPLVPRHKRHRSSGISCNNIDDIEHLVYSKGDHITLKDREFFENITKKKSPVNMGPRKLSLNSKPLRTCTRDISPIETKRDTDKWTCTLSTQHSFMRTFTEETTERFRRLTTETEGGEYSHRRRKSLARTRDFRHTTTTGMYGDSGGVVKRKGPVVEENLWVIDGRPTILENVDRVRRAEEFLKESNNLKMEIHNEIDNLTKAIQQKMNIK